MGVLAKNKRAYFDYDILEEYEAGLVLKGFEVKSIKTGHVSLKGSYVTVKLAKNNKNPEVYLINAHVSLYKHAGEMPNYNPTRSRKLLLNKKEIRYLIGKKVEKSLTLIPLRLYTKHNLIKLSFALARGKKKRDKREVIKRRELDIESRRAIKTMIR